MTMQEQEGDTTQSQVGVETAEETQPDQTDQPGAGGVAVAEVEAKSEERTYSQEEVSAMQATADRDKDVYAKALTQYALNDEIRKMQEQENYKAQEDQALVDEGRLTPALATQRSQERVELRQKESQSRQREQEINSKGEALGRIMAAQDFAKKYGVDSDVLIKDPSLTAPELMEAKARQLSLDAREEKLKGTESFDTGQKGGRSTPMSDMSGAEMIRHGLNHPPKGQPKF
jgi:hypothetical protein